MPPGGHLRPLGGGFLITVAAHKCGLHLQQHGGVHQQQTLPQRTNADCILGGLRVVGNFRHPLPQRTNADCIFQSPTLTFRISSLPQRTNADCIGNIAQKCDILFCRLRCESVDSFSGITKDACADYFPVLFYCQGNQRCHYRQSRTDNRPVFYGANCTGFFCKLLLRTYARMLLRIPILESVFGISDSLRID